MRSLFLTALSSAALLGFSAPALAHPGEGDDEHAEQHEQLGDEHADVHEQLNSIHDEAHEEGLTWQEHEQLHRQLDRAHGRADGNIAAQHYYQHQNAQYGYGGYENGYSGYGAPQGYYGNNGYSGYRPAYSFRIRRARHHRYNPYRGY